MKRSMVLFQPTTVLLIPVKVVFDRTPGTGVALMMEPSWVEATASGAEAIATAVKTTIKTPCEISFQRSPRFRPRRRRGMMSTTSPMPLGKKSESRLVDCLCDGILSADDFHEQYATTHTPATQRTL